MAGKPVTIRLLDPPLHEFLPQQEEEFAEVAKAAGVDVRRVRRRVAELRESNPMLGLRGCRLGILFPEIYEMQAQRDLRGGDRGRAENRVDGDPRDHGAAGRGRTRARDPQGPDRCMWPSRWRVARRQKLDYRVGTMIELPRAALRAGEIAAHAEFFSFGTNDLTQMTWGISRDDAGTFLEPYLRAEIFKGDPFQTLDLDGVGELAKLAAERGRATRPDIKLGICGEHGGDPATIRFCESVGLDYVSCSPYRVPIARLAAAQAALAEPERD